MKVFGLEVKLGESMATRNVVSCIAVTARWAPKLIEALRTGRQDFLLASRKLADKFLELLGPSGVPEW